MTSFRIAYTCPNCNDGKMKHREPFRNYECYKCGKLMKRWVNPALLEKDRKVKEYMRKFAITVLFLVAFPFRVLATDISTTTCPSNVTAAGCVVFGTASQGTVGIQITGTFVGTLQIEGTVNGVNYVAVRAVAVGDTTSTPVTSTTGTGTYNVVVAGLTSVRVRFSAYTSGTATVIFRVAAAAMNFDKNSGGTVTSIDMTVPSALLSVSGVPVTGTGTIAVALPTRTANTLFAGPTTGAAATPTFRALVTADLPAATVTGGTCTNQAVTSISTAGVPTCTTLTSSYVNGTIGLTANPLSQFASTTSAQLIGVISDETGTGSAVFGTNPTLTITPVAVGSLATCNAGAANRIAMVNDALVPAIGVAVSNGGASIAGVICINGSGWIVF